MLPLPFSAGTPAQAGAAGTSGPSRPYSWLEAVEGCRGAAVQRICGSFWENLATFEWGQVQVGKSCMGARG